jgi:hypothetical protein
MSHKKQEFTRLGSAEQGGPVKLEWSIYRVLHFIAREIARDLESKSLSSGKRKGETSRSSDRRAGRNG